MLLIDDIQSLQGREQTRKSSSTPSTPSTTAASRSSGPARTSPNAIATLEDRLRSRFEMGLIDIQPPDVETRIAILQKRVLRDNLNCHNIDVLSFIAERVTTNVRALEGALARPRVDLEPPRQRRTRQRGAAGPHRRGRAGRIRRFSAGGHALLGTIEELKGRSGRGTSSRPARWPCTSAANSPKFAPRHRASLRQPRPHHGHVPFRRSPIRWPTRATSSPRSKHSPPGSGAAAAPGRRRVGWPLRLVDDDGHQRGRTLGASACRAGSSPATGDATPGGSAPASRRQGP